MEVNKSQPIAVRRVGVSYEIYSSFDDLHDPEVEPLSELCSEYFELFTGVTMEDGEIAEITLKPSRIFVEKTEFVQFKLRKS